MMESEATRREMAALGAESLNLSEAVSAAEKGIAAERSNCKYELEALGTWPFSTLSASDVRRPRRRRERRPNDRKQHMN